MGVWGHTYFIVFLLQIGRLRIVGQEIPRAWFGDCGGTILFLIAVRMIFPSKNQPLTESISGEPFIVPLAIPYIAGPSALVTLLLILNRESMRWPQCLLALLCAWLATGVIISAAVPLSRFLGKRVVIAIERLMGMILVAIAIQMLMNGISEFVESM